MTHAIFETGGKQYRVKEGDEIFIELLGVEDNEKVKFDKVLAVFTGDEPVIGTPYVTGAAVTGKVIKSGKAKKIIVYKMKRRKGYRRKQGHRQPYTKILIDKISAKSSAPKKEVKEAKEAKAEGDGKVKKAAAPKAAAAAAPKKAPAAKKETTTKTAKSEE